MSAALDTVGQVIFLCRLDAMYGIRNGALMSIASYLLDGTEKVHVNGYTSPYLPFKYDEPLDSVLGLRLFIMCTGELEPIIISHRLLSYCYADDCQLSFFCNPDET